MAKQNFFQEHWQDDEGKPTKGLSCGRGFTICWNSAGGTVQVSGEIVYLGAQIEDVLSAVISRIAYYQEGKFACDENAQALSELEAALSIECIDTPDDNIFNEHWTDSDENPAGGFSSGDYFAISWQNGPLGRIGTADRREPNGAFVETVLQAIIDRAQLLLDYPPHRFISENMKSDGVKFVAHLRKANEILDSRTKRRAKAGTEGTHEGK